MPADKSGAQMNGNIGSEENWILQHRAHHGIVHTFGRPWNTALVFSTEALPFEIQTHIHGRGKVGAMGLVRIRFESNQ